MNWIKVTLDLDQEIDLALKNSSDLHEIIDKTILTKIWCAMHLKDDYDASGAPCIFYFKNKADAILFKLTWC
jgi:hypothetical protein